MVTMLVGKHSKAQWDEGVRDITGKRKDAPMESRGQYHK